MMERLLLLLLLCPIDVQSFLSPLVVVSYKGSFLNAAPRYGPMGDCDESPQQQQPDDTAAAAVLDTLIDQILATTDPNHVPSLLTKYIPALLALPAETLRQQSAAVVAPQRQAVAEMIIQFLQDFTVETERLDNQNKEQLGRIIRVISGRQSSSSTTTTTSKSTMIEREQALDELMQTETFTAGFLRHLQGECERIENAQSVTRESRQMLELLHVVQARILEEMGQDLGQAAQVLGQLLGYESTAERLAVLEAGLTVRGVGFAHEMSELTAQALSDFERRPDVDAALVETIKEIDERLRDFLEKEENGFQ